MNIPSGKELILASVLGITSPISGEISTNLTDGPSKCNSIQMVAYNNPYQIQWHGDTGSLVYEGNYIEFSKSGIISHNETNYQLKHESFGGINLKIFDLFRDDKKQMIGIRVGTSLIKKNAHIKPKDFYDIMKNIVNKSPSIVIGDDLAILELID